MLKNKNGTYNIFRLSIIAIISLISIFIIGTVIVSNIQIPDIKITELNFLKPTPTPIASKDINSNLFINCTYDNTSTNSIWFGQTYEVGGGSYSYPTGVNNVTFIIIAGGGSAEYIIHNNSSDNATYWNNWSFGDGNYSDIQTPVNQTILPTQTQSNISQNLTIIFSNIYGGNSNIFYLSLFIIPFIVISLFIRNRSSIIMILIITCLLFYFNIISFIILSIIIMGLIFIMLSRISDCGEI